MSGRRSVSPLVLAPVIITCVIVAVSLWPSLRPRDPGGDASTPRATPPATPAKVTAGWYLIHPQSGRSAGRCLSVLPDQQFAPVLADDTCVPDDPLQRFRLDVVEPGLYTITGRTTTDTLWCATVESAVDGARVSLRPCVRDARPQRFTLEPTGTSTASGPVLRLRPVQSAGDGMCVEIDRGGALAGAVQTRCGRTDVRGYVLTPATTPLPLGS